LFQPILSPNPSPLPQKETADKRREVREGYRDRLVTVEMQMAGLVEGGEEWRVRMAERQDLQRKVGG